MSRLRRRVLTAGLALFLGSAGWSGALAAQQGVEQPASEGVAALRQRAQGGDAEAQFALALTLMDRNDPQSLAEARDLLRRVTATGDVEAQNAYAGLLLTGRGGPRDETEGRRLMLDAAARGSFGANVTLSMAHLNGTGGFPRDPRRAFTHMEAAARSPRAADGFAQWRLGMMHLNGIGTARNEQEAYRWVAEAADRGSVDGMTSRAVMLAMGQGVAADPAAARTWYERAAQTRRPGWAHALRGLGGMLVIGQGGPADLPRGFGYLLAAYANGDREAGELLARLRSRITPEIERQALAIAAEWGAAEGKPR